jgi:3-oxoacyl-[acyl-carrier protein] reductase
MSNDRRTAIVTGAARGIGAAVATRLAADGHAVAVVDLDEQACKSVVAKIEDDGGTALAVAADVSDEQSVAGATAAVADQLGGPTILVNNAGITRDNVLRKMSVDDWDAVAAVHLRGNFLFSRAVQPHMREAGWGRIVNLSSVSALGNLGQANYAAAKAGVQGITKTLAIELGRNGVTVNAVAPGFIETEMTDVLPEGRKAEIIKAVPAGRLAHADEVAAAVTWLASDASGYITGAVIPVDGGLGMGH